MKISVCIATFNGEKYLQKQVDSIIKELGTEDEVIFCDDGSTDNTISILESYCDNRFRIINNNVRLGHVRNFEKAISLASGEYIFLSDQDDVWIPGRVSKMIKLIQTDPKLLLLASNFDFIDQDGFTTGEFRSLGPVKKYKFNQVFSIFLGKAPYFGCTFLLKRVAIKYLLPIPNNIESHDIWIALIASSMGRVINMAEPTLFHRVHGGNLTAKRRRALSVVLKSRFIFVKSFVSRLVALRRKF